AKYLDSLFGGDARIGRALFREKEALACIRCHKIDDAESKGVGPDLRGIGRRYTRMQILEAIVEPNATIAKGFESTLVFLKDDTHVEGRILSVDAEHINVIQSDGH